ncbi:MAG: FAD-dependent oxidoreductase [Bacteroidota bacterium]
MNQALDNNIVILGAGFAGLAAAKELEGFGNVSVISPNASFEFFPNIHELVSGYKRPEEVRLDVSEILAGRQQVFVQEKAVDLDRERQVVITDSGASYSYDCLIVAMGGVNNDRGVPGVDEHAFSFKSAADCYAIGQRLVELENQNSPYSITIVGGGVEGVEALGEVLRKYGGSPHLSIQIVEAEDQFLPGMSREVHREILELCQEFSVSFHFGQRVSEVKHQQVHLSTGESLASDLTIWTGGVKSHPQLEAWGLAESGQSPPVNRFLQSTLDAHIWIVGDAVDVTGGAEKQAYLALEMGQVVSQNVRALLKKGRLTAYQPKSLPSVYSFGNLSCFIVYKDFVLSGLPFAGVKEAIYQLNMAMIQDIFGHPLRFASTLDRGLKGAIRSLDAFLDSPRSWFAKFSIGLSVPEIFED